MRATLVFAQMLVALLLCGCGGPLQYPKGYDPTGFPNRSRLELFASTRDSTGAGISISGQVLDEQGKPIVQAVIMVSGSEWGGFRGSVSDENGKFSLILPPSAGLLEIRVLGEKFYTAKEPAVPCNPNLELFIQATLSPCGPCLQSGIVDPEPMIDYKSTSSGSSFLMEERTGELRVRRPP